MDYREKWNLIAEQYVRYLGSPESEIQKLWEAYCSELFDYKKLLGEIDSQRSIHIGSAERIIPDIILRINNKDVFDIELKQYSLAFDESFEKQIISYLNQTHLEMGMIVCRKIYLYEYDYLANAVNKVIIPFEKDSDDGIRLVELICRNNFNYEDIKRFVSEKIHAKENVETIQKQIDAALVKKLIREHFLENYSDEEISKALENYQINIFRKTLETQIISPRTEKQCEPVNTSNQYVFDIGSAAVRWCKQKKAEGMIVYDDKNTNAKKSLVRFTTSRMDEYLLQANGRYIRTWDNNYLYEINLRDSLAMKIWMAIKNHGRPQVEDRIEEILKSDGKSISGIEWEWKTCWSTKSVKQRNLQDEKTVFEWLDKQFEELMTRETSFFVGR